MPSPSIQLLRPKTVMLSLIPFLFASNNIYSISKSYQLYFQNILYLSTLYSKPIHFSSTPLPPHHPHVHSLSWAAEETSSLPPFSHPTIHSSHNSQIDKSWFVMLLLQTQVVSMANKVNQNYLLCSVRPYMTWPPCQPLQPHLLTLLPLFTKLQPHHPPWCSSTSHTHRGCFPQSFTHMPSAWLLNPSSQKQLAVSQLPSLNSNTTTWQPSLTAQTQSLLSTP